MKLNDSLRRAQYSDARYFRWPYAHSPRLRNFLPLDMFVNVFPSTPRCFNYVCVSSFPTGIFLTFITLCFLISYIAILWPVNVTNSKQKTNVTVLTFVYYSVSATCFDPAGSLSGRFHDVTPVIELRF
jgi:hypothetical protein